MLSMGPATRIYVGVGATDMRKGFEGLYGLVRDRLLCEPTSGHLFLFCNGQRNRVKVLFWDGSGLWVCAKRLADMVANCCVDFAKQRANRAVIWQHRPHRGD